MPAASTTYPHRDALLAHQLKALFPDVGPETLVFMQQHLQWVEIAAGETLISQGAPGDSAYLTISGRLRVYVTVDDQAPRMVRELSRGEVIGEMSLYTGEPRSATVIAVRDSVLVRLAKEHFEALLVSHPQVSLTFTRQMIRRLQTEHERHPMAAPVTVGLLPVSAGVAVGDFAQRLANPLAQFGRVVVVDSAEMDRLLGERGITARADAEADHRISLALDGLEAGHDFVLLLADASPGPGRTAASATVTKCCWWPKRRSHLPFTRSRRPASPVGRRAARPPRFSCSCIRPRVVDPARRPGLAGAPTGHRPRQPSPRAGA